MDSFRRANKSYKVRMECQHAHSPLHSCRLQTGKKQNKTKLQASISKVKPELRIARSLENPQREKEEMNPELNIWGQNSMKKIECLKRFI